MSKGAWAAWAVKNSVVILCFTGLAIHFDQWWIALFALFFTSSLERKSPIGRACNGCGKTIYSQDWDAIDEKARKAGWVRQKSGDSWEDYCPECQKAGHNDTLKSRL